MDSADKGAGRTARLTRAVGAKAEADARTMADVGSENLMVMVKVGKEVLRCVYAKQNRSELSFYTEHVSTNTP